MRPSVMNSPSAAGGGSLSASAPSATVTLPVSAVMSSTSIVPEPDFTRVPAPTILSATMSSSADTDSSPSTRHVPAWIDCLSASGSGSGATPNHFWRR